MYRISIPKIAVLLVLLPPAVSAQESRFQASSSSAIVSRSAFAHGYLQGYESSYHQGNVDANMARPPKTRMAQFKELPRAYKSSFGSKKSFERGFNAGLKAGYGDGYYGRAFRAVSQLREAGAALDREPPGDDPTGSYFDKGLAAGYRQGLDRAISGHAAPRQLDDPTVSCPQSLRPQMQDAGVEKIYCDGYRRGFVLGSADGAAALPSEHRLLETSE